MSRYTWLLDPGHGGMIDGVYQTKGKRSPSFDDGVVLYEGEFNRAVTKQILEYCDKSNIDAIDRDWETTPSSNEGDLFPFV